MPEDICNYVTDDGGFKPFVYKTRTCKGGEFTYAKTDVMVPKQANGLEQVNLAKGWNLDPSGILKWPIKD
jgi:hypothetical protein